MLISIPKKLLDKIGEEAAEDLVELLNTSAQYSRDLVTTLVEEKFERRLSQEIATVREELHRNQSATVRWMFLFWVGQIGALMGILFAFFQ